MENKRREYMYSIRRESLRESVMTKRLNVIKSNGGGEGRPRLNRSPKEFVDLFTELRKDLEAAPPSDFFIILENIRKLLSENELIAPVDEFIDSGLLPHMFRLMEGQLWNVHNVMSEVFWYPRC
jgi:hypothetical protein